MTETAVPEMPAPPTQSRFEGPGVLHPAKYLGSAALADGQSQLLCQEAMQSVLAGLKGRKEPKERLEIRLSLADGIQIREVAGSGGKLDLKFGHTEISYVFKEPRDQRSCGLVRTEPYPDRPGRILSRFYAIRTVKSAAPLMQDLRELFQLVKQTRDKQLARKAATTASSEPTPSETKVADAEQQATTDLLMKPAAEVPSPVDLLDIRQEPAARQSAISSSLGSLDELSELFGSQASLASSGVGGGAASFNPFTPQPMPQLPPPAPITRQLSQPHPGLIQLAGHPIRKASDPNVLEQRRYSNGFYGNGYQGNKRPSDPGAQLAFLPSDYYLRLQQAEYFYQQQQQQQQQMFALNPFAAQAIVPGPYHPLYLFQQQQQQQRHLYQNSAPAGPPAQPLLQPTSGTQLIEGDFVSVFDRPPPEQQQRK